MLRKLCFMLVLSVWAGAACAEVRLAKIFTSDMLLQRDQPIRVWGWAAPQEAVTVILDGQKAATTADAQGKWLAELPARKQGENLTLTITGQNSISLTNVIIGDVWLCAGQSNMEWLLKDTDNAAEDSKAADLPKIRRIKFNHVQSAFPEVEAPAATAWQVCTPRNAGGFSAVGFYFAREIQAQTGVPIGILDDNWGGTPIEPWTPPAGMESVPELREAVTVRSNALAAYAVSLPRQLNALESWLVSARAAASNAAALPPMPTVAPHPGANGWCSMYHAMIHPLVRFPIKGALWYQGESNGGEGETYYHKMRALVGGWRKVWNQGDFPFYFVQLASFQNANDNPAGGDGWAKLREAQTRSLGMTNTGMAVILDTVPLKSAGDIHPRNKSDVGQRLARWALNRDYGQKDLVVSGPLYKSMKVEGNKIRLSFDYVGSGLMVGAKEGRAPAAEVKDGTLKRFAIAGADRKWVWAEAVIDGQSVVVSSGAVPEPVAVRYAFSMNPDGANLYNREGLPASPFRTDNW
ncbi:MAG: sialate O-acetylesterase [Kiritimatiellia bacterium]